MILPDGPLVHEQLRLEPLAQEHRPGLVAAGGDPGLFRWWPRAMAGEAFDRTLDWLEAEIAAGRWRAFTVIAPDGRILGQTCYLNIEPAHDRVEIGGTWYAAEAQGGVVNPVAKLLMLGGAFDGGAERVELKTDSLNARSRAAILKLGATFEGVFRHHLRRPDGTWRDTAWYSILRAEWPGVRDGLIRRIAAIA